MKKIKNKENKKQAHKEIKDKVGLFNQMPDMCDSCNKPFDKQNREQVFSWSVIVRRDKEEKPVHLYCPPCWEKAQEMVKNIIEGNKG